MMSIRRIHPIRSVVSILIPQTISAITKILPAWMTGKNVVSVFTIILIQRVIPALDGLIASFEKLRGKTKKSAVPITRSQCEDLIAGHFLPADNDSSVLSQIYLKEHLQFLHPAVIVEYERTAFTYPIGNVRITFDRNISAIADPSGFFSAQNARIPVLPTHEHVLEVKYDELLPDHIAQLLELDTLTQTACSKYFLCRQACDITNQL